MATRRGDIAKQNATEIICKAFPGAFIQDKKIYITVPDGQGGEVIQLALTMTMPKNIVESGPSIENNKTAAAPISSTPIELSAEDRATIEELKKRLNVK